jgi:uncharacterized protein YkwD
VRRIQNAFMSSPDHRRNVLYREATQFGASTWIAGRAVSFDRAPMTMAPSARSVVGR